MMHKEVSLTVHSLKNRQRILSIKTWWPSTTKPARKRVRSRRSKRKKMRDRRKRISKKLKRNNKQMID
jgi:hypothetical protein